MKKILKFILVTFIWLLVLGVCVTGSILLNYGESVGVQLFISLIIIWYGTKFCVYLYRRFQAKRKVENLINIGSSGEAATRLSFFEFLFSKEIDKHIKRVIRRLQLSMLGHESSEDIDFIMHLKMHNSHSQWLHTKSANKPQIQDPVFSERQHFKWIAFNHFVMLDIDAYLTEDSNPPAHQEWLQLLNGLASSDKTHPLNGLLISIHVQDLVDPASRNLLADSLRRRYEEIKEYCGVEVPISIALLGLEELRGVDDWLARLSQEWKKQTLGIVNHQNIPVNDLVQRCFSQTKEIFTQASLGYLVNHGFDENVANLPHKINDIERSVASFCERLSAGNSFQRGARTSGFFIVMAEDSSIAFADELLEQSTLNWTPPVSTNMNTESDKIQTKRTITYLSAAAALILGLGMVNGAVTDNIKTVLETYQANSSQSSDREKVITNYQDRYQLIEDLGDINIDLWLPMSSDVFNTPLLSAKWANDVQDILILPIDKMFAAEIIKLDKDDADIKVDYINILMRRINILNAASSGASFKDMAEMPQPFDSSYIDDMSPTIIDGLNDLYLKSLFVQQATKNTEIWQEQIGAYRQSMSSLVLSSDGNMDWLVDWVNTNAGVNSIALKDYWQGSISNNTILVAGAYTIAGKEIVDDFLEQIVVALGEDNSFLSKYLPAFERQYQANYLASWNAFLTGFDDGKDTLKGRSEWLNVVNNLSTSRNIFFKLLNDADFQLTPYKSLEEQPDWMTFVFYYQNMLALGDDKSQSNPKKNKIFTKLGLKVISALGPAGKAIAGSGKSALKTKKKLDKSEGPGPGASERELNMQAAAKLLDEYKGLIATMVFNVDQRKESYKNIEPFFEFENSPNDEGTNLANAKINIINLQGLVGKVRVSSQPFWNVYTGAVSLLEDFMISETACVLQDQWESNFLTELDGVPGYKLEEFAYGETGVLWSFYESTLSPFFKNKRGSGYGFKQVAGEKMPLSAELLDYLIRAKDLSKRAKFDSFPLQVTAKPTDTNANSLLYVSKTDISLLCSAGNQTLSNNNYIVKKSFNWDESCRSVSLKFSVGNKVLEKVFDGDNGVLDFLTTFKTGTARFELDVFPDFFYELDSYKIQYFDVNLEIKGGIDLRRALSVKTPKPPSSITQCWS